MAGAPSCWARTTVTNLLINKVAKRLWEIGDIKDYRSQISSVLRVRNMLEIVLGVLVVIGVFVFWCDVTDSWNKVLNKTGKR